MRSIARGLPLDYGALKKRLDLAPSAAPRSPAFIELPSLRAAELHATSPGPGGPLQALELLGDEPGLPGS